MFRMFKRLRWFYQRYWFQFLLAFVLGLGVSFFLLVAPAVTARVINGINNQTLTQSELVILISISIGAVTLVYLTAAWRRVIISKLIAFLSYAIRKEYLQKILSLDSKFFTNYSTGDLLTRSQGDIDMVVNTAVDTVLTFFMQLIGLALLLINMFSIHPTLTWQIMIPLPLLWITLYIMTPILTRNWIRVREELSHMTEGALETVKNARIIRAFNMEQYTQEKNNQQVGRVFAMEKRTLKINALYHPMFEAIATGVVLLSLWLGGSYVLAGSLEIGDLLQFHVYAASLMWPFVDLGYIFSTLNQSNASLDRLLEILDAKTSIQNERATHQIKHFERLDIRNFSFRYPSSSMDVLKSIDISISAGQTIGIVGKTSSGKSTLLRQILRLYPTPFGTIKVNGNDLMHVEPTSFLSKIGYVPQEHALFAMTVEENILLGALAPVTLNETQQAIYVADFQKDVDQLSEGIQTLIGENGTTLSGGQRQRLSIARALIRQPEVLILDDSFSAVDGTTEANIVSRLKETRRGLTNIIVTHRLSAIKDADLILVMDEGKVIARGTHEQLLTFPGYYVEQFLAQQLTGGSHE